MSRDELAKFVRKRARELDLPQTEIARRARISRQALVKILAGEVRDPRITTVIGLARALQVSPFFMLRQWLTSLGTAGSQWRADMNDGGCSYVGLESLPNGSICGPDQLVTMHCTLQNSGTDPWEGRSLKCIAPLVEPESIPALVPVRSTIELPSLAPGATFEAAIEMRTPKVPGMYVCYWKVVDAGGNYCFPDLPPLDCVVNVINF